MKHLPLLLLLLAAPCLFAAETQASVKPAAPKWKKLLPATPEGFDLRTLEVEKHPEHTVELYVYVPRTEGRWPCILDIHGGGWKRLLDQRVSNDEFKARLYQQFGIERVYNYYGMVEQVGSIFMECEHGHLHSPSYADVLIRDPHTLQPLGVGQQGVIQVQSAIPLSYPGHSLLTEDVGTLHGQDDCPCGRAGSHFTVSGRLPQVEMRGCSDTRAVPA